jgi:hypothetical protein
LAHLRNTRALDGKVDVVQPGKRSKKYRLA